MDQHNQLIEELFGEIFAMKRQMQGAGQRIFRQFDLTRPQLELLYTLTTTVDPTLGELGGVLGISSGAISQMVEILSTRGLVAKTPDPADRRVSHVNLTPAGRELRESIRLVHLKYLSEHLQGVSSADLRDMTATVRKLRHNFETKTPGGTT